MVLTISPQNAAAVFRCAWGGVVDGVEADLIRAPCLNLS